MRFSFLVSLAFVSGLSTLVAQQTISGAGIPPSKGLVTFSSEEGVRRFQNAKAKADFYKLANHFESQRNGLFCGPTTAAIVLNSLRVGGGGKLPKDTGTVLSEDLTFLPKNFDPLLERYTPDEVVKGGSKSRSEVFGKPVDIKGQKTQDFGYQLRQLEDLLKHHDLKVVMKIVDNTLDEKQIRADLNENLSRSGDYVILNYKRSEIGQKGGGHISPLGAYDSDSDSYLIMDVNPVKAEWVWVPAEILIKGMRTFDTVENRGYLLVSQ